MAICVESVNRGLASAEHHILHLTWPAGYGEEGGEVGNLTVTGILPDRTPCVSGRIKYLKPDTSSVWCHMWRLVFDRLSTRMEVPSVRVVVRVIVGWRFIKSHPPDGGMYIRIVRCLQTIKRRTDRSPPEFWSNRVRMSLLRSWTPRPNIPKFPNDTTCTLRSEIRTWQCQPQIEYVVEFAKEWIAYYDVRP